MMRRKGDLVKNTLGILLMVAGLAVFIIGIGRLYFAHTNQESENAKQTLNLIMDRIDALPDGQTTQITLQGIPGAENWYLVGWNKSVSTNAKPEKCFFESCICLCPESSLAGTCQQKGFCRMLQKDNVFVRTSPFEFTRTYAAGQQGSNPFSFKWEPSCIILSNKLLEITLSKNSTSVTAISLYPIGYEDDLYTGKCSNLKS